MTKPTMRADESVLGDLLGVPGIAQELVHHRENPGPNSGHQFRRRALVTILEAVDEDTIEATSLAWGHTVCLRLMGIF